MSHGDTLLQPRCTHVADRAYASAAAAFDTTYRLEIAATPAQRERAYAVRYQVYCEEFTCYEPKGRFPDKLEHNASDDHSIHLLVSRRADGIAVATARLVLTDPADPTSPLPFEEACSDTLHPWALPEDAAERWAIAEVSRYAILGAYRQHHDDVLSAAERQAQPVMALVMGLFCHAVAQQVGLSALFGVMDARFADLSRAHGVQLTPIGRATAFHGTRTPFSIGLAACAALFPELDLIAREATRSAAEVLPHRSPTPV